MLPHNYELLEQRKWPTRTGYIRIEDQPLHYLKEIQTYWCHHWKPRIVRKIVRTQVHIRNTPDPQLRMILIAKNQRRHAVIQMYDDLITHTYNRWIS